MKTVCMDAKSWLVILIRSARDCGSPMDSVERIRILVLVDSRPNFYKNRILKKIHLMIAMPPFMRKGVGRRPALIGTWAFQRVCVQVIKKMACFRID